MKQGILAAAVAALVAGNAYGNALEEITIVGSQAYPLNIFPGYAAESSFFDGAIGSYAPSLWDFLLGCGGVAAALLVALLVLRVLPILPQQLQAEES